MKFLSRHNMFLTQAFLIILGILSIWYLFIYKELFKQADDIFAGAIAILGLFIGLAQIWINQVSLKRNKRYENRYNDFKNQFGLFRQLSKSLKESTGANDESHLRSLLKDINAIINEAISFNGFQNEFLFTKQKDSDASNRMTELLNEMRLKIAALEESIEMSEKSKDLETSQITQLIEEMNWHNEIRDILADIEVVNN